MYIDKEKINFIKIIEVTLTCSITKRLRQCDPPGDTQVFTQLSLNSTGL
jgi:hypothetical protein